MYYILSVLFFILAAICNAMMDTLQFHWYRFRWKDNINIQYWNSSISWRNKYIDRDPSKGLKYKGWLGWMSNFLDAWHLFKMIMIILLALSVVVAPDLKIFNNYFYDRILFVMILGIAWNAPFNLFFNKIFVIKNK